MSAAEAIVRGEMERLSSALVTAVLDWQHARTRLYGQLVGELARFSTRLRHRRADTNEALQRTLTDREDIAAAIAWISERDKEDKRHAASVHQAMRDVARLDRERRAGCMRALAEIDALGKKVSAAVDASHARLWEGARTQTLVAGDVAMATQTVNALRREMQALERSVEARLASIGRVSAPDVERWPQLLAEALQIDAPAVSVRVAPRVARAAPKKMARVPGFLLSRFYDKGSLRAATDGFSLTFTNRIAFSIICGGEPLSLDGRAIAKEQTTLACGGQSLPAHQIDGEHYLKFPKGDTLTVMVRGVALGPGEHRLRVDIELRKLGWITLHVQARL